MKRPSHETCELLRSGASVPTFDSAVASLVENSLNAGATHVFIVVSSLSLSVEVRDNGNGIHAEDMKLLFQRYFTSSSASSTIQNHGETLCNLAAISRSVEVTSRHSESTKTYTRKINIENDGASGVIDDCSKAVSLAKSSRSVGTTVCLNDLFHRLPVRRKAAQSTLVLTKTKETIGDLSVLWPKVTFVLVNQDDGHELLHLVKCKNELTRFCEVHGIDENEMVPIDCAVDCPLKCKGWITTPLLSQGFNNKQHQLLLLNHTMVKKSVFHQTVENVYRDIVMPLRSKPQHPAFLLLFQFDNAEATAVVEPADKSLISLTFSDVLIPVLESGVRGAICGKPSCDDADPCAIPFSTSRKKSSSGSTRFVIVRKDDDKGRSSPLTEKSKSDSAAFMSVLESYLTHLPEPLSDSELQSSSGKPSRVGRKCSSITVAPDSDKYSSQVSSVYEYSQCSQSVGEDILSYSMIATQFCSMTRDDMVDVVAICQLDKKYILAKWHSMIIVFDQHAVHERIRLEKLENDLFGVDGTRYNYEPIQGSWIWPLTDDEASRLLKYHKQVEMWGFRWRIIREYGGSLAANVTQIPGIAGVTLDAPALKSFLLDLESSSGSFQTRPSAITSILATRACKSAIKFGDRLALAVCQNLLTALGACRLPFQCAHGRPNMRPLADCSVILSYSKKHQK